jgi:hypothetical protein
MEKLKLFTHYRQMGAPCMEKLKLFTHYRQITTTVNELMSNSLLEVVVCGLLEEVVVCGLLEGKLL